MAGFPASMTTEVIATTSDVVIDSHLQSVPDVHKINEFEGVNPVEVRQEIPVENSYFGFEENEIDALDAIISEVGLVGKANVSRSDLPQHIKDLNVAGYCKLGGTVTEIVINSNLHPKAVKSTFVHESSHKNDININPRVLSELANKRAEYFSIDPEEAYIFQSKLHEIGNTSLDTLNDAFLGANIAVNGYHAYLMRLNALFNENPIAAAQNPYGIVDSKLLKAELKAILTETALTDPKKILQIEQSLNSKRSIAGLNNLNIRDLTNNVIAGMSYKVENAADVNQIIEAISGIDIGAIESFAEVDQRFDADYQSANYEGSIDFIYTDNRNNAEIIKYSPVPNKYEGNAFLGGLYKMLMNMLLRGVDLGELKKALMDGKFKSIYGLDQKTLNELLLALEISALDLNQISIEG